MHRYGKYTPSSSTPRGIRHPRTNDGSRPQTAGLMTSLPPALLQYAKHVGIPSSDP